MSNYLSLPGAKAASDLSSYQFCAVKLSSNELEVTPITNANAPDLPVGILQDKPDVAGQGADVAVDGVCKAIFGGNVSVGNVLGVNNSGQLIAAPMETSPATADLYCIAVALQAGSSGTVGYVRLIGPVLASTE